MKVVFRVDESAQIGTGHMMRCLTLADALNAHGGDCTFVCRRFDHGFPRPITERGHAMVALPPSITQSHTTCGDALSMVRHESAWPTDAEETRAVVGPMRPDWLIVDHYGLDYRWERALAGETRKLMVIDDLADRRHECNLLLDQSLGRTAEDYSGLAPGNCELLLGSAFALLRPQFAQRRAESVRRRSDVELRHLLIMMGGADSENTTSAVLRALESSEMLTDLTVTVVMGKSSPHLADVRTRASLIGARVLVGVEDVASLMSRADLAIGAGGTTAWERCCLGLPSLIVILASNQEHVARSLEGAGAAAVMTKQDVPARLAAEIARLASPALLRGMSLAASKVTSGDGSWQVASRLEALRATET